MILTPWGVITLPQLGESSFFLSSPFCAFPAPSSPRTHISSFARIQSAFVLPKVEALLQVQGSTDVLTRLALLHLLIHARFGYLLHPTITDALPKKAVETEGQGLRIADIGTGTGYATYAL